jgi:copper chaperone CopZ
MAIFSWFGGKPEDRPPAKHYIFSVKLSCNGCCNAVRKAVEGKGGVHGVHCNLEKQEVTISGWLSRDEAEEYLQGAGKDFRFVE